MAMQGRRRAQAADYAGSTESVAESLLGAILVHNTGAGRIAGRIVEVEAYLAAEDQASHSRNGPTRRNAAMFLPAGHAYVYRIYGLHACFNVVTGPRGVGEAVLIRALEPLEGLAAMQAERGTRELRELCNGPAKLVQALAISTSHDGVDLCTGPLFLELDEPRKAALAIQRGPRIGITRGRELALRYCIAASPWLSLAPAPMHARANAPVQRGQKQANLNSD